MGTVNENHQCKRIFSPTFTRTMISYDCERHLQQELDILLQSMNSQVNFQSTFRF